MAHHVIRLQRLWLPSVLGRLTFLLLVVSLLILYFYLIGNLQGFTDRTLMFLFAVESWTLALCSLAAVFSAVAYAATLPFRYRLKLGRIVLSVAAAILSLALYLGMALLQAFMKPYLG